MEASREEICLVWRALARTVPGIIWSEDMLGGRPTERRGIESDCPPRRLDRDDYGRWWARGEPHPLPLPPPGGVLSWTLEHLRLDLTEEQRAVYELEFLAGVPAGEVVR